MRCRPFAVTLLAVSLQAVFLPAKASAQRASGHAFGFDDERCPGVVVQVFGKQGLLAERLTDADGAFDVEVDQPIAAVVLQVEGVSVRTPVAGHGSGITIYFARQQFATLRGRLLDPGGGAARDVDLVCRDPLGDTIATVTTWRDGTFVLRTQLAIGSLLVDPCGWAVPVAAPPLTAKPPAEPVVVDLSDRAGLFFGIRGNCFDDTDRPAAGWRVTATHGGRRVAATTSDADGSFVLWCRTPIDELVAADCGVRMGQCGTWEGNTRLDLRERDHGLVLVRGRVVDADGRPVAGAHVLPSMTPSAPSETTRAVATTDARGHFVACTFRGLPFLFACDDAAHRTGSAALPGTATPLLVTVR